MVLKRADLDAEDKKIVDLTEEEDRSLNEVEQKRHDEIMARTDEIDKDGLHKPGNSATAP